MTTYLLAGGGTAGHVNPLLATADFIKSREPDAQIICLGTSEGLESRLIPQRGYELTTVAKLPFPRRLNLYAIKFPFAFSKAVGQLRKLIAERHVDVVVGFGGYASAPAYEAARKSGVRLVIHEANALPGMANRQGAKYASAVGVAFRSTKLPSSVFVGMPLRSEIESVCLEKPQKRARQHFGLKSDQFTLLVTGGSLGAKRLNEAIDGARNVLVAAGIQILHIVGDRSELAEVSEPGYRRIRYCDRMDLAIAASDFAVSRAGASTVSEFSAAGLPALYVPYAVGNGEQEHNVAELVTAGASLMVKDSDFTETWVRENLISLLSGHKQVEEMTKRLSKFSVSNGSERLYELIRGVLKPNTRSKNT